MVLAPFLVVSFVGSGAQLSGEGRSERRFVLRAPMVLDAVRAQPSGQLDVQRHQLLGCTARVAHPASSLVDESLDQPLDVRAGACAETLVLGAKPLEVHLEVARWARVASDVSHVTPQAA